MTAKIEYPLKEVLSIKIRRVEEQEKVVKEKQKALEREQEKLRQREEERDRVKQHKLDKLNQLREELDHATTSPKVQQMKAYLKVVEEKVKVEEKKVQDQKEQVEVAERELEAAQLELKKKRLEVDKIETHKENWLKAAKKELQIAEERELDEIGSISYLSRKRKK